MSNDFAKDYVDVAERIMIFRDRYPDGCLRPFDPAEPVKIITITDRTFLQYVACAYRTPEDQSPGIGIAWEPFPGRTPFTKDSEAMVVETSAWGRAIVAALAADTKRGIATQQEVRNRRAEQQAPDPMMAARGAVLAAAKAKNPDLPDVTVWIRSLIEQRKTPQTPDAYYELAEVIKEGEV